MKKDVVIKVENLSKQYSIGKRDSYLTLRDKLMELPNKLFKKEKKPSFWALKDINLEVKKGEILGIIGRNGAGKSTLLKIFSRITEPTSGKVTMVGRVASMLEVGTGFNPELTGRENVYLNGAILGMSRQAIRSQFSDILEFAGLEKFIDTPVKHYSSGMQVRLAFAVSAHLESDIMIIDEVLAVGDAEFQTKCLGKMGNLTKSGRTIIFVSHNMTAIQNMCDRTILLEDGQIKIDSDSETAISQYLQINEENIYQVVWEANKAPHNSSLSLDEVALTIDGQLAKTITTNNPFQIMIRYRSMTSNVYGGIAISIHDQQGALVFSSINNQDTKWHNKLMPKATFTSTCTIPQHLLNEGLYSLSVNMFTKGYVDLVSTRDVIIFEVIDGGEIRGDYTGKYGGSIRPKLNWKTTKDKS